MAVAVAVCLSCGLGQTMRGGPAALSPAPWSPPPGADRGALPRPPPASAGGGPERLHLFLVLAPGAGAAGGEGELLRACQAAVSARLNPLFRVEAVAVRDSLPRTASNKVTHRTLRDELLAGRRSPQPARL